MIYAPLFTGLAELLKGLAVDAFAYLIAAAVTGAIGAVLYGARELSLISSALGAGVGVVLLIALTGQATFVQAVAIAAVIAAAAGLTVRFPSRCSRNVGAKALAGLMAGAIGGALLTLAELLHPEPFAMFVVLSFLVSVNGILYVSSVGWWVKVSHQLRRTAFPCYLIEAAIMAMLAGIAAGSVWMIGGPLTAPDAGLWQTASMEMHHVIPQAILGGLLGGGIAGMLLEFFRFSWVHDL